jgi:hypothetical protein
MLTAETKDHVVDLGTLSKLRGVGGLSAHTPERKGVLLSDIFTSPAGDGEETAHGLWVRQLTVDNPPRRR